MKYVLKDKLIQIKSTHTNKKYLSCTSAWNQHLGLYNNDMMSHKKVIAVYYTLIDIKHSSVEGEKLSIWFDREEIVIG